AAEVAVRPALTRLSAAAVCAPSRRLFKAQITPAMPDCTRSDFSQLRSKAKALKARAQRPVAWISRSDAMRRAASEMKVIQSRNHGHAESLEVEVFTPAFPHGAGETGL